MVKRKNFIEELHEYSISVDNFSIYLAGIPTEHNSLPDDEPGVEYQMASKFIKNLNALSYLNPKRPILVHMKTCGGIWEEGMAIYDAIKACPNPLTILSYTHARSMSSLILQAADKRVLMPHSYFLFHDGTAFVSGTIKRVVTEVEWGKKAQTPAMLKIYVEALKRKGKFVKWSAYRIEKMLRECMDKKEDVYLTAQEAVEWGFADEIFGSNGCYDWHSLRKHTN